MCPVENYELVRQNKRSSIKYLFSQTTRRKALLRRHQRHTDKHNFGLADAGLKHHVGVG